MLSKKRKFYDSKLKNGGLKNKKSKVDLKDILLSDDNFHSPKTKIKDNIYKNDCMEFMKTIKDNSIALTITSPPYNKGNSRMERVTVKYSEFNDRMPWKRYMEEQINVLVWGLLKRFSLIIFLFF